MLAGLITFRSACYAAVPRTTCNPTKIETGSASRRGIKLLKPARSNAQPANLSVRLSDQGEAQRVCLTLAFYLDGHFGACRSTNQFQQLLHVQLLHFFPVYSLDAVACLDSCIG